MAKEKTPDKAKAQLIAQAHLDDRQAAKAATSEASKWVVNTLLILNGGGLLICIERLKEHPTAYWPAQFFAWGLVVLLLAGTMAILLAQNSYFQASKRFKGEDTAGDERERRWLVILILVAALLSSALFMYGQNELREDIKESLSAPQPEAAPPPTAPASPPPSPTANSGATTQLPAQPRTEPKGQPEGSSAAPQGPAAKKEPAT